MDKKSQFKKASVHSQDQLCHKVEHIQKLEAELRQELENVDAQIAERKRLRIVLLDRTSVLTQLRVEVPNMTDKRGLAAQKHLALRDRVESVVAEHPITVSTPFRLLILSLEIFHV